MKKTNILCALILLLIGAAQNYTYAQCTAVPGSLVQTPDGASRVYTCPGDGNADIVTFTNTGTNNANYAYAITDTDNRILMVTTSNTQDFEGAGPGLCRVFGFSYNGTITAQPGDLVYSTRFSDDCWFISNNAIEVVRTMPDGGTVATPSGATSHYACLDDGIPDFVGFTNTSTAQTNYRYVITDDQNNILGLPPTSFLDFSGAGVGVCRVWGLSFTGNITANVGDNAAMVPLSDGCFDLSDNFITVVRNSTDGGTIATPDGENRVYTCTGDAAPSVVDFVPNTSSTANYAYAITNSDNVILALELNDSHDFNNAPTGTCRVFGFSYTGSITAQTGDHVYSTRFSDGCYAISRNAIEIVRTYVDGGTVAMPSGETTRNTCPGDGEDDIVMFEHENDAPGTQYAYVITDDQNNILGLPPGNSQNFEGAGVGVCRVWGLSYTGNILAQGGDNAATTMLTDGCFELSSNFITVIRSEVDGGTVAMPSGETTRNTCPGDGEDDIVMFEHENNAPGAQYAYVITDDQNNILGLPPGNSQNFEGAGPGVCRVWGLSYTGNILAQGGDNAATTMLTDGCFELSSNFITVIRTEVDGGTVAMPSGETTRNTCPGDGEDDIVMFEHENNAPGAQYAYVITDNQNNILGLPPGNSQNFEGAGPGVCRVWGLSYTGNILAEGGDNAATTMLTDGCFELSSNFITVIRSEVDGGTVSMPSGATTRYTCPGDGEDDIVMFIHENDAPGTQYAYVITDDQNNILGLPPGDSQNFEGAGVGVCRVWGLSYTGNILAEGGDNAATTMLTDGCFELSSNFIEVIRDNPDGGTVSTTDGETELKTCAGDGIDDLIPLAHTNGSMSAFRYIVTDDQNNILATPPAGMTELNFEGAGAGICRIWGLSYTGMFTAETGQNAATTDLSDECFELSSNFIEVTRTQVDGGTVSMPSGATTRYTCPGDGEDDIVMFIHENDAPGTQYAYVITDDQNNILGIPPGDSQNFEGAGVGVCRVWGLSYTGNILAEGGDNAATTMLTDGCFELSSNFIEVIRDNPDGGTVSTTDGETELKTCAGDGIDDLIPLAHTNGSMSAFRYIVTDDQNNILATPPAGMTELNFEGAGAGICRIWGLSYTGMFTAETGQNAATTDLSDECFELSSNFIEVTRTQVDGGTVSMPSGATTRYTCPGDGEDDIVMFIHENDAPGTQYAYVITDDQNNILGIPPGDSQNFEGAGVGVCRVWGLSYTGNILAEGGDNAATTMLTDGCFELSSNFIEVIRDNPDGGTVSTTDGETELKTCAGDGIDDLIPLAHTNGSMSAFRYIVTDDQNNILATPPAGMTELNFEGAGAGICRIWGLSYTGMFTAETGQNAATTDLSDECFELSSNFIEVTRTQVDGGTVSMPSGATTRYTCPGDGEDDIVMFIHENDAPGTQYAYVITDDQNNILGIPPGDSQNFEGAGVGVCRVWGLSYTGTILAEGGDNAATTMLTDGCFELSSNFIEVIRDNPDGGTVSTTDGETEVTTCAGDGDDDLIGLSHDNNSMSAFRYVVTDDQNIILATPPVGMTELNFEGAGAGICRIWGLSYTGMFTAEVGQNAAEVDLSSDCFELSSNFITVIRNEGADCSGNIIGEEVDIRQTSLGNTATMIGDLSISPNPAIDQLQVQFNQKEAIDASYDVQVFDAAGQLMYRQTIEAQNGFNQLDLSVGNWDAGFYILQMIREDGQRMSQKFVKQNR